MRMARYLQNVGEAHMLGMMQKVAGGLVPYPYGADPVTFLQTLWEAERLRLPFDPEVVFWIPNRLPVLGEVKLARGRSILLGQLYDSVEYTALVVDTIRREPDSIHVARLIPATSMGQVGEWMSVMNPRTAMANVQYLKSDENYVLVIATLRSFVVDAQVDR